MPTNAFLARQPIVDAQHRLLGYELLYRHAENADDARIASELDAGIQVIANTLFDMGTHWLLGGKLAFINVGPETLLSPTTTLLPADKVVIELTGSVLPTPEIRARLDELSAGGYRFSLDNLEAGSEREELVPHATFVKVDARGGTGSALSTFMSRLYAHPVKLIAERVEDLATFRHCQDLGFDYFQGYYFAHPENLTARVINPSQAVVLQLLEIGRAHV
jgi:EAL and modified HD-GYP domain-containing signal transduction protein